MRILITGFTGTLGQQVTKGFLEHTNDLIIGYSRDEMKQRQMPNHKNLTKVLGDVRDRVRLVESSRDVDLIFHFAALKCVDTLEENPEESIATNVLGTENVLHAQRVNKIPRVILSSTDKAVYPITTYGACKLLAEKLVLRNPNNVVVRYGNVLASRGSAVPTFINSLRKNNSVEITHKDMTRFFMRIEDAADFVVKSALAKSSGLKIYNKMKATKMSILVSVLAEIMGVKGYKKNITGIRFCEKINEDLVASHEGYYLNSSNAKQYTKAELVKLLTPLVKS